MSSAANTGIVILAAGSSSRLGRPKQLLEFDGTTLLSHATVEAANSKADSVVVVLGADAGLIVNEIDGDIVYVVENKNWREGMASSIRLGLNTLLSQTPSINAVILMVCDQPYISSSILNELIATQQKTTKPIVACNYGETTGPPALFHKSIFDELMQLKGDIGARKIIQQHKNNVATILFTGGKIDIDTIKDYEDLKNS